MPSDLREIPTYTIAEAAHYLRIPKNTLERWVLGYNYKGGTGSTHSKALIQIGGRKPNLLSFFNLVEAHVLSALRRDYRISMLKIRKALDYLEAEYPASHPFADYEFQTDGIDLFIDRIAELDCISQQGQLAMRDLLLEYLHRIERDEQKLALRLYPFVSYPPKYDDRLVVIDPAVSYGRPAIAGSGIPTAIIAERFKAGESFEELKDDYGRTLQEIQEAIRCELKLSAA